MLFFTFSNADIQFVEKKLTERFYTTLNALFTIKQMELISKTKFTKATLDEDFKTFVVYIEVLKVLLAEITIHSLQAAQIINRNFVQAAIL